jgi:hypothetical protein
VPDIDDSWIRYIEEQRTLVALVGECLIKNSRHDCTLEKGHEGPCDWDKGRLDYLQARLGLVVHDVPLQTPKWTAEDVIRARGWGILLQTEQGLPKPLVKREKSLWAS